MKIAKKVTRFVGLNGQKKVVKYYTELLGHIGSFDTRKEAIEFAFRAIRNKLLY